MGKKFARAAHLARRIAEWLVPVLTAIKLFIEIVSKVANCNQATAMIENYKHKYRSRGKFIFVPNERCERRGRRMLEFFSKLDFPDYLYHYKKGGHVAALHAHLRQPDKILQQLQPYSSGFLRMKLHAKKIVLLYNCRKCAAVFAFSDRRLQQGHAVRMREINK